MEQNISLFHTDVLVIGGGQAALRASIEARKSGASVIVVSKGKIGGGGSSVISDAVHSAIVHPDDSPEQFYQDMLIGGRGISDKSLISALAQDCTERVHELENEFGVPLVFEKELITPGHRYPRRSYHASKKGTFIVAQLREAALQAGVQFIERTRIADLIQSDKRIIGAIGLHDDREPLQILAASTILATGGIGGAYAHSDNPIDVTGEGIGMAWRHGAELRDLEFIQFYPYRLVHPKNMDLYTKMFLKGASMLNGDGVRFMGAFPRKELETRDVICYEMFKQDKVLLDVGGLELEELANVSPNLYSVLRKGYDGELLMQPVEHYSIGGITIDEYGRTTVPGLYACGECTGGVHGANRLGGGALTEALVIGARAGKMAAQESVFVTSPDSELSLNYLLPRTGTMETMKKQLSTVRGLIQQTMWRYVGIERTEEGLKTAIRELIHLSEQIVDRAELVACPSKQVNAFTLNLRDMLEVARITAESALMRKESRGAHRRKDKPEQSEQWNGSIRTSRTKIHFTQAN